MCGICRKISALCQCLVLLVDDAKADFSGLYPMKVHKTVMQVKNFWLNESGIDEDLLSKFL